jgi:hypothetical protein
VPNLRDIARQARAFWALLASAFKHEWTIEDYPIDARFQRGSHSPRVSRLKPSPWTATIVNWPAISGNGNTKLEALKDLRSSFDRFKATKNKLPRPGTKVPIKFADRNRVSQHPELLKEFIQRILELDWAWISDESSLDDFHGDETNDKLIEKIRHIYGVDVSDIPSGNLADIFDRITKHRAAKTVPSPD